MHEVRKKLRSEFSVIKEDFQHEIPIHHLESLAAIVYGPFLYGMDLLVDTNDMMLRVKSASAQDAVMDGIFWASQPQSDPRFAGYLNTMLSASQEVSKNRLTRIDGWLNGIKGGVSIIRALESDGWNIALPDYANNPQEVLEWDINNYIDFIAEREGKILFIDAKARLMLEEGQIRRVASVEDRQRTGIYPPYLELGLPQSLSKYEHLLRQGDIKHLNIIVPSAVSQLPNLQNAPDPKTNLQSYGITSEQSDLVSQINNLRW
jgi:hypothetical protein